MMNTNRARTIRTIRPAVMRSPSFAHERGRAPDLEHLHARPRLERLVLVVGPGGPDLPAQAHAADPLGVGEALHDDRPLPDEGGGARLELAPRALVLAGDRPQRRQH